MKISEINGYPVEIEALMQDISTKGIFYCEEDLNLTESEEKQLKDQGVTMIYRIKYTDMYAVTFDGKLLPDKLMISRLAFEISLYVPKPRRCFRCQRYGHTESHCRHPRVCPKCSNVGHTFEECNNNPSCYHCFGPHPTSSHDCPRFILEQLVLDYKVTKGTDFHQARSYIYKSYPNIVNKIPRLKCSVSHYSMSKTDSENSLIENIVENLNKTIEAQQSQIDILIGELREYKSHLNSKSLTNEASHMTQTSFHSHIEILPMSYDQEDTDMNRSVSDDDLSHLQDIHSENAIPLILAHQKSSEVESFENVVPQSPVNQSSPLPNDVVVFSDYLERLPVSSLNSSLTIPDDMSSGISDLVEESELSHKNQSIYDDSNIYDDRLTEVRSPTSNENSDLESLASMGTHEKTSLSSDFTEVIYDRRGRLVKPPIETDRSFENKESSECRVLSCEKTPCEDPHGFWKLSEKAKESNEKARESLAALNKQIMQEFKELCQFHNINI